MDRLTAVIERRRWIVIAVWLVLLVAAAPLAMRQTEHLTSGGFAVPGSDSEAVDRGLAEFDRAQAHSLAVIVARRPGASDAEVRAAVDRVDRVGGRAAARRAVPRAAAAGQAPARRGRPWSRCR